MLGRPRQDNSPVITARAEEKSRPVDSGDASSIALGVIFCLFLVGLLGLSGFFFFRRRRQVITRDVEKGDEKRNWWMVEGKEKSLSEWWRRSHSIPERVEAPPSAGVRTSLQKFRTALTRKGALRGLAKQEESQDLLIPPVRVISPNDTINLPMQTVPQSKPRYPSVLERGYRVPLYPIQDALVDRSPPRSLTSPATHKPRTVAERNLQRQVALPPRALSVSKGRLVLPRSERKVGLPRSPARKHGMLSNIQHPFMPLKESETAFPTISAPMPSQETAATNPKLGYPQGVVKDVRFIPASPAGPRLGRVNTRRVPAPLFVPPRPKTPASPLGLRATVIFPPGQSPGVRPSPVPI